MPLNELPPEEGNNMVLNRAWYMIRTRTGGGFSKRNKVNANRNILGGIKLSYESFSHQYVVYDLHEMVNVHGNRRKMKDRGREFATKKADRQESKRALVIVRMHRANVSREVLYRPGRQRFNLLVDSIIIGTGVFPFRLAIIKRVDPIQSSL